MHHLCAQGQKRPSGLRHAWIKRFFCASVHLISIIAGCLPRKFLPEVIAHQVAQALLHKQRNTCFFARFCNMFNPFPVWVDFVLLVAGFSSNDDPINSILLSSGNPRQPILYREIFLDRFDAQENSVAMAPTVICEERRFKKKRLFRRCYRCSKPEVVVVRQFILIRQSKNAHWVLG